jgi:hypothetical protein
LMLSGRYPASSAINARASIFSPKFLVRDCQRRVM